MKQLHILALAALALGTTSLSVHAHGNQEHAARAFDARSVEDTAFGREGDPRRVDHTIRIDMADTMRFTPGTIRVRRGQTVKFVLHNSGQALHEMVLGTAEALQEHAALMKKFPNMEHDSPNMAHVKPGQTGEIVWQFTQAGIFSFACLLPGHYEAGMTGSVRVQ